MNARPARDSHPAGNGTVALGAELSIGLEDSVDRSPLNAHVGEIETGRVTELLIRLVDIAGATILLVLLAPILLVVAFAVRLDSPGPSIYRQRRLGRNLEPFSVAKFRTMREGSAADAHRRHVQQMIAGESGARPMTKLSEDSRVTRVGGFLRRSSIDELPQLWNVLRGQMSLVGPRPPIQYEVEKYPPWAFRRFAVKPGITGLWQVRGRSLLTFDEMIALDTEYVERRSLPLNLKILALTLPTVIHGKGAA